MIDISTLLWAGLVILLLRILYWYGNEPYSYWKNLGIPSAPTVPFLGSLLPVFIKPGHNVMVERYKQYGKLFGLYEGRKPVISVADPDITRDILVKDFHLLPNRRDLFTNDPVFDKNLSVLTGDEWKRVRTIISPSFSTGKMKKTSGIFLEASKCLCNNFDKALDTGKPIDTKRLYGAFAMDVIASSAFGTKLDSHNDPDNPFVTAARNVFIDAFPWRMIILFAFPKLAKLFRLQFFPPKMMNFFKDAVIQIIKERKRTGKKANDFLQLMMDVSEEVLGEDGIVKVEETEADENQIPTDSESNMEKSFKPQQYKSLSVNEVLANCIVFFIAGYEGTSSTLSMVSYVLALHPECQEKLINEIDDVLKQNNNQLTYEGVQSMHYMDAVINETLRMYTPSPAIERVASADYKLKDTGLIIPKGMIVQIPIYAMHLDPQFYPEPERFDPNRFLPEGKAKRNPYLFVPFGAGPRNCIGMRFAVIEMKFCLAYIFSQFRFKTCAETKVPLEYSAGVQKGPMQPKQILLKVERRDDKVWNGV